MHVGYPAGRREKRSIHRDPGTDNDAVHSWWQIDGLASQKQLYSSAGGKLTKIQIPDASPIYRHYFDTLSPQKTRRRTAGAAQTVDQDLLPFVG